MWNLEAVIIGVIVFLAAFYIIVRLRKSIRSVKSDGDCGDDLCNCSSSSTNRRHNSL